MRRRRRPAARGPSRHRSTPRSSEERRGSEPGGSRPSTSHPAPVDILMSCSRVPDDLPDPAIEEAGGRRLLPAAASRSGGHAGPDAAAGSELDETADQKPPLEPRRSPSRCSARPLRAWCAAQGRRFACSRAYWKSFAELMDPRAGDRQLQPRRRRWELGAARAMEEARRDRRGDRPLPRGARPPSGLCPGDARAASPLQQQARARSGVRAARRDGGRVGPEERRALRFTRAELLWSRTGDDAGAAGALDSDLGPVIPTTFARWRCAPTWPAPGTTTTSSSRSSPRSPPPPVSHSSPAAVEIELGRLHEARGRSSEAAAAYRRAIVAQPAAAAQEGLLRLAAAQQDPGALADAAHCHRRDHGQLGRAPSTPPGHL